MIMHRSTPTTPFMLALIIAALLVPFLPGAAYAISTFTPGDHTITNNALTGGTFSIGMDGRFTALNLTFDPGGMLEQSFTSSDTPIANSFASPVSQIAWLLNPYRYNFDYDHDLKTYTAVIFDINSQSNVWETRGSVAPIPEPSTIFLLGTGLAGLAAWRYRKTVKA